MKTVIEMAREAGWYGQQMPVEEFFERFAALVREDEREHLSAHLMDYNQGFVDGVEEGRAVNEREKQQEPVALVVDCDMLGTPIIGMVDSSLQIGDKLYTTPQTAALAARQMRDAAVKAVQEAGFEFAHEAIAALPVLEVQWRDLTDSEIELVITSECIKRELAATDHHIARAVIAKLKEKQL